MTTLFTGAHTVIYSRDAAADREVLRDILGLGSVDAGDGWLIFALPPGEVAVHPHETSSAHELYLICEDVAATRAALIERGISCTEIKDEGWGILSALTLPGGGAIGFYQPRHARP